MNGFFPAGRSLRCGLALWVLLGLKLAAQPADAPLTNIVTVDPAVATNTTPPKVIPSGSDTGSSSRPTRAESRDFILASARYEANTHDWTEAEMNYQWLLASDVPEALQQTALFELAQVVRAENDLPRAEAIYTQYLQRWPGDARTPEVFLRQGQVFREMDLPELALTKFYGVMTTALSLKDSQLDYYKNLVLQAQVEIAETYYRAGKFKDAVDYFSRLLAQENPALDRAQVEFRLIRSLEALQRHDEASSQALDFLAHFPDSPEAPEVRYHLAQAYQGQHRNTEALQQVKLFLKAEHDQSTNDPAVWAYWQQRMGNEIGNELYQEGDYVKALEVYQALAQLDPTPAWQLPARYQVALTYEKLLQPRLAMEAYRNVLTNSAAGLGTNLTPNLKAITDMAAWRLNFLEWSGRAEAFNRQTAAANTATNNNLASHQP
jgi:tetratricopeptide (TPR) repeat protein